MYYHILYWEIFDWVSKCKNQCYRNKEIQNGHKWLERNQHNYHTSLLRTLNWKYWLIQNMIRTQRISVFTGQKCIIHYCLWTKSDKIVTYQTILSTLFESVALLYTSQKTPQPCHFLSSVWHAQCTAAKDTSPAFWHLNCADSLTSWRICHLNSPSNL